MLDITSADNADFRKKAFDKLILFLRKYNVIKPIQKNPVDWKIHFNPLYVICGSTCAGKSTIGRFMLEKYNYYHIEASDFMTIKYLETHGNKSNIDKHLFALELLKIDPLFVVQRVVDFLKMKSIHDDFIITGFRTTNEVLELKKIFNSSNVKLIYVNSDYSIRYERWVNRKRDSGNYSKERFLEINQLQEKMGLLEIKAMQNNLIYENNKEGVTAFFNDFRENIVQEELIYKDLNLTSILSIEKLSLEKAILLILAIEFCKNESSYFTTTEIAHLINNSFKNLTKNKNNISRYFNQAFYPYYEIRSFGGRNKYKLSPTGYSEAIFTYRNLANSVSN